MLPFGHAAAGYLIAKTSSQKLTPKAIVLIILAANIFDLDFLVLTIFGIPGGQHHYYPGHTFLMGLVYWLLIYLIFRNKFSRQVFILVVLSLLSHLVIDDFSYWLSLAGLEKGVPSQINWLFPIIQKSLLAESLSNLDILRKYLIETPKLFYLELLTIVTAIVVFVHDKISGHEKI